LPNARNVLISFSSYTITSITSNLTKIKKKTPLTPKRSIAPKP
jgi:hypothetical protein